jgi:hypothetical protein
LQSIKRFENDEVFLFFLEPWAEFHDLFPDQPG